MGDFEINASHMYRITEGFSGTCMAFPEVPLPHCVWSLAVTYWGWWLTWTGSWSSWPSVPASPWCLSPPFEESCTPRRCRYGCHISAHSSAENSGLWVFPFLVTQLPPAHFRLLSTCLWYSWASSWIWRLWQMASFSLQLLSSGTLAESWTYLYIL